MIYMCGIIGYSGPLDAQTVLLVGLTQLESPVGYRQRRDRLFDENSKIHLSIKFGKVAALRKVCEENPVVSPLRDRSYPLGNARRRHQ